LAYFKSRFLPYDSAQAREKRRRMLKLLAEFKALHNVDELTPEQAGQHLESIERFVRDHPELKPQINDFYARKYGKPIRVVIEFLEKQGLKASAQRFETVNPLRNPFSFQRGLRRENPNEET